MKGLKRLSFWTTGFSSTADIANQDTESCFGYALLKYDLCPSKGVDSWHVFESALRKYDHTHNYCPCAKMIPFRVGARDFAVPAVLYCQQNGLNKVCAQVALRSICATYLGDFDLTFRRINELAFGGAGPPGAVVRTKQIPLVLAGLGIPFFEFAYTANDPKFRDSLPYQRLLYTGIEAGTGSLVGFKRSGPKADNVGHIIPCFGHTFNEDTWVANADGDYFKVGETIKYMPSDMWLSSFIGHDDNFGSNLCIPKGYMSRDLAQYVVALLPRGFEYNGLFAEFAASDYFYSLVEEIAKVQNPWLDRLLRYALDGRLILRTVPITQEAYLRHLGEIDDWDEIRENSETLRLLQAIKPQRMWMIEVSIPDLFSTNKRKIGELLLDATRPYTPNVDFTLFVLARFPGCYLFFEKTDAAGRPEFSRVPSLMTSHTAMLRC
jgi:hypothetical protein